MQAPKRLAQVGGDSVAVNKSLKGKQWQSSTQSNLKKPTKSTHVVNAQFQSSPKQQTQNKPC